MRRGWMVVAGVVVLCGGLGPVLTGCAVTEEFQREFFDRRTVNLTDSSYAAVDALTQQLRPHVSPATPLRVAELTDVATPGETTPFGRHVSTQIGSRLVQLGYNVRSAPLPPAMIPHRAHRRNCKPDRWRRATRKGRPSLPAPIPG